MVQLANEIGHSDRPLERLDQDSLGLGEYAQGLAHFIQRCETPFTVAVQGDWGTGKTSLMKMVDGLLTADKQSASDPVIQTVWFHTWQYSQFGSMAALPVSLLATLLRCLAGDTGPVEKARQVMGRLMKPVANAALRFGTMGASELGDFEGVLAQESIDSAANASELKEEINKLVQSRLAAGCDRIVIFIDDLDRIKPAIAVEILETIKLFVDCDGCIFVLALDYGVVSHGLKDKFGISEGELGRSFFDKIIQLPFTVPVAHYTIDKYIDGLFGSMNLPMTPSDGALFAELVRHSVSVNPRGIKRVFNSLQLLVGMQNAGEDRLKVRVLFAILCLQIHYGHIYTWLLNKGDDLSADDLEILAGGVSDNRDAEFTAALATILDKDKDTFARFAATFFRGVQNPDGSDENIDDEEIDRLRGALTLSRVTSVRSKFSPLEESNNPDFRSKNRQLFNTVQSNFEQALAGDGRADDGGFWINTAHMSSKVWLRRSITPDGSLKLVLEHGENEILLFVEGEKKAIGEHAILLKGTLAPLTGLYSCDGNEGPVFFRRSVSPDLPMKEREALLLGEVRDLYLRAHRALGDVL